MSEAHDLIRKAESCGLRIGYDSGFTTVRLPTDIDDSAEMLRQLSRSLRGVADVALERARAARASDFLGGATLIPEYEIIGTIVGLTGDIASISYVTEESKSGKKTASAQAQNVIVAVPPRVEDRDDFPVEISSSTRELLKRAGSAGLQFGYCDGFVLLGAGQDGKRALQTVLNLGAPKPATGEDAWRPQTSQWSAHMKEIRRLVIARTRAAAARAFVGASAIADIDEFQTGLSARGTIKDFTSDFFILSCSSNLGRDMSVQIPASDVLILLAAQRPEMSSEKQPEAAPVQAKAAMGSARRLLKAVVGL